MSIEKFYNLAKNKLFKINRSITGNGVKETLNIIKQEIPRLKIKKIKSGKKVFDWKIPSEWNVNEAYLEDKFGEKIINFKDNNLHLLGYSIPFRGEISRKELLKNCFSISKPGNAIPYRTSYYKKRWGFCITSNQKKKIINNYKPRDKFKVNINTNLNPKGFLNYGEVILRGKSKKEILISTYICHPSMANNELSGPIVSMSLIKYFQKFKKLDKTLRFIFIPETIGSIAYISKNFKSLKKNLIGGFNLTCIGDERQHSCMLTKNENTVVDESLLEAYKKLKIYNYKIYSFLKRGSDERQYNSPGVDLDIASIFRSMYGEYPEYHTSLDDFKVVTLKGLIGGYKVSKEAIKILSNKITPKNKILCEPNMGKRNLYPSLSTPYNKNYPKKMMDFLQYANGKTSLETISKKIKLDFKKTNKTYLELKRNKLLD